MIATDLEGVGQAFEYTDAAMADRGWFAVHGVVEDAELAAEGLDDSLQTKADAEYREAAFGGMFHDIGNAEVGRPAGAGRDQDQVRSDLIDHRPRNSGAVGHHVV